MFTQIINLMPMLSDPSQTKGRSSVPGIALAHFIEKDNLNLDF